MTLVEGIRRQMTLRQWVFLALKGPSLGFWLSDASRPETRTITHLAQPALQTHSAIPSLGSSLTTEVPSQLLRKVCSIFQDVVNLSSP